MRILVVEDDPILSDGLRAGLGLSGATVECVATCADADAALATSRFGVVVLDLMLPGRLRPRRAAQPERTGRQDPGCPADGP